MTVKKTQMISEFLDEGISHEVPESLHNLVRVRRSVVMAHRHVNHARRFQVGDHGGIVDMLLRVEIGIAHRDRVGVGKAVWVGRFNGGHGLFQEYYKR